MRSTEYRRLALLIIAGVALTGFALTLFRAFTGEWLPKGCSIAGPLGWAHPITTAFVVIGAAWLLMSQVGGRRKDEEIDAVEVRCPSCGLAVLSDWRLCPYCTAVLDDETTEEPPPARA